MEVVGWVGTSLYLLAQILLSVFSISRFRYVLLNALAAFLVSVYSLYVWSLQPVFINVVWTALSLIGLKMVVEQTQINKRTAFHSRRGGDGLSLLLVASGAMVFLLCYSAFGMGPVLWLSWLSFWLYSATYFCFIFFRLSEYWFFILCIISAAIIIPQLVLDGNFPVIGVQVLWIFWSAVGVIRVVRNR